MSQLTFLQRLELLGYYPLPRAHPFSPGFSGLLTLLKQESKGHEPESLQLYLLDWNGKASLFDLRATGNPPHSSTVCPGRIIIRSQQKREVTFYTFGGSLEYESLPGETLVSIRSAAPILELTEDLPATANRLANETEALFARIETELQVNSAQLRTRLALAGAEPVYLAILRSLLPEAMASLHPSEFSAMLDGEQHWYAEANRWPDEPVDLYQLLEQPVHS
ncbi:MAG: hypothetical protein KDE09_17800 [Anaerolineales bacterium]|nr:hypothetical protein [Anaerolineales bacterium]